MKELKNIEEIRLKFNNYKLIYFLNNIYGVNSKISKIIINYLKLRKNILLKNLLNFHLNIIINILKKLLNNNIKLKIIKNIEYIQKLKTYKGMRHLLNLPCNGQRTHTNRKTKKNYLNKLNNNLTNKFFIKV
jgi:small subunit ribosomal protein S13